MLIAEHAFKTLIPGQEIKTTLKNKERNIHLTWNLYLLHQLFLLILSFSRDPFISLSYYLLLPSPITGDKPHMQTGIKDQKCRTIFFPDTASWPTPSFHCNYFLFPYTVGGNTGYARFPCLFLHTVMFAHYWMKLSFDVYENWPLSK